MASSTLAIPTSYHKPTPAIRKSKLEPGNVRSEDELLKFFLHGSYDVQRGSTHLTKTDEDPSQVLCLPEDQVSNSSNVIDETRNKSRFMFEETYMINISVKQPDALPAGKQIDVRIEKTPTDQPQIPVEKVDDDEISSIFDEDEHEEIESVVFNEIPSTIPERPSTPLTLADMISKTLTTIPPATSETNNAPPPWFIEKSNDELKTTEKKRKSPAPTLTANRSEDEKLFQYLDYLETKEESNPIRKELPKINNPNLIGTGVKQPIEPIPIIDLEELCRSLTVNDLKDESIRKKIFELKLLIDERHKKIKTQIPLVKPRKDHLPVLIAMPAAQQQQRRRTTVVPTATLLQSKTVNNFQTPSYMAPPYHEIPPNQKPSTQFNPPNYLRRPVNQSATNNPPMRKFQFT